jgi:hypothetical protein
MNYQQKLKLIKEPEIVEMEIDNQIVFILRSSNNNQEETKTLKSLEEAEAYFNKMKAEFEENGFAEQIDDAFIPKIFCNRINNKLIFIPRIQFKERSYPDEYQSVEPVEIIENSDDYEEIGKAVFRAFSHSRLYNSPAEKVVLDLETIFPLINVKEWDEYDTCSDRVELVKKGETFRLEPCIRDRSVQENEESAIECPGDEQQLGKNLIDLLNLVADNNPNVVKYFNQNKGSVPGQLAHEVIEQVRRLGGKFRPKKKSKIVIDNFLAPEAIALWYTNSLIEFPRKTFATDEDNNNSYWVWDLCFEWSGSCKEFPAEDTEGKFLSMIAMADGGNYILAIDLNDPDPSNPKVYSMDHYDPEQILGDGVSLSDFLADLTEEP